MGSIRFIQDMGDYSTYERPDGSEVYVAHGFPRVYLVEYDDDWMREQWERRSGPRHSRRPDYQRDFFDWLREHLLDPDVVDDLRFCTRCEDPTHVEDGFSVEGDAFACDFCADRYYYQCHDCDTLSQNTTTTVHEEEVCESCRDRNYSFCEHCDAYYHDSAEEDHDHDEDRCGCESPALTFAIRNDGEGTLSNDQQVTVSLPAGTLDAEGIARIQTYLHHQDMWEAAALVDTLDKRWQTREGNFTKRLSRALYKKHGRKIPPAVLSQVGSIARDHSTSVDFSVATTRDLNMSPDEFYHDDSCWWQSYSEGRCALKANGGFGLRSFHANGDVSGRAWVMPLKADPDGQSPLRPTFDTVTPDAFVVFNGYGQLEGYTAARIVSHMAGMTYRKVTFTCSPMFINGDSGYLVAPEEIATDYTDGTLRLTVDQHSNLFRNERENVNAVNV